MRFVDLLVCFLPLVCFVGRDSSFSGVLKLPVSVWILPKVSFVGVDRLLGGSDT